MRAVGGFTLATLAKSDYRYSSVPESSPLTLQATSDYSTTPNPSTNWGTWDGWGVSLCWWANVFGQRDDIADAAFTLNTVNIEGTEVPGLGFNIARYNAGGSAWKSAGGDTMNVSPNIPHWKQIHGFWEDWDSDDPSSTSFNWTDSNQIAALQKAQQRGADRLELFSNSPMWWMLYNHNPSGADIGLSDNLQSWNYEKHATYMATVAKYARENWGVKFESVEPFNEPMGSWWTSTGTQEGCHFKHGTQKTVAKYMRQELDRLGVDAIVSASDENTYDAARNTWASFDDETKNVVGRVNVHGYQKGGGRRDLLYSDVAGKPLWNSEYGDGDGTGMSLASNLNLDFRWLHNTAYCYWQLLDEASGWGLMRFDSSKMTVVGPNVKFWVLAQYSRHIRPGMTIIDGGEGNTVAAYDSASSRLVLVTTNYGTELSVTFDLSNFGSAAGPVTRWVTNTADGGDRYAKYDDVQIHESSFTVHFAQNTVQTIEVDNVMLADLPESIVTAIV